MSLSEQEKTGAFSLAGGQFALALDSALGGCVCGFFSPEGRLPDQRLVLQTSRDQAARLVPMVQDLLHGAGLSFDDIGLLVTTVGPGSFTGLRIGLSAAKSFALSLGIPLVGVTSFAAMAETVFREGLFDPDSFFHAAEGCGWVLLETKREDFYVQKFRFVQSSGTQKEGHPWNIPRIQEEGGACCFHAQDLAHQIDESLRENTDIPHFIAGDSVQRFLASLPLDLSPFLLTALQGKMLDRPLVDPVFLARKGYEAFCSSGGETQVEPLYMRGADVSCSNKKNREILF